ncbi:helix-hairpin-helix domain-containing protein [Flavobacterium sp. CS20]|uniref:helix-hairpin-helix domain-containing protein n=1 Tax=Flavobacterium sp. CS20 TaxID=2775246 RepID=UPI001B3A0217|nr:helix-hairpin-helix domain-containing protein [Flavobacterium sp. CS20]QTY27173.1 helix-hairpin-helix domain-containing protein [Flavobacterium sp. CS20]
MTISQQNGVFLLVGLIIVCLIGVLYYNYNYYKLSPYQSLIDTIAQQKIDSLKIIKAEQKPSYQYKIYPFNPNFLKEGKAYRLGLSAEEHNRLIAFRDKGKWINSVEDFQNVTQVSDEILKKILPYFKFPDWVVEQQKAKRQSEPIIILSYKQKQDLNIATAEDLQKISGVGEVLSKRIIAYRDKIGKFRSDIQLKDVWGLKYDVIDKITAKMKVKSNNEQPKIDINQASLIELTEVPYFDYELAREIFQFIKVNQGINSFEELSKLQQFPTSKIDRIKLYLAINK